MFSPRTGFRLSLLLLGCALLAAAHSGAASAQLLGPTEYVQKSDSPFFGQTFGYFHLEDFENGALNTPGVSSVGTIINPGSITDSVDEDDGTIDGFGLAGHSWFGNGLTGISFEFDETVLGSYPTHVGIVWTDGTDDIEFEAWDAGGTSLGKRTGTHADGNFSGGTGEDRFYGIIHPGGVSKIHLRSSVPGGGAGIEMDHLQYGGEAEGPPPLDTTYTLSSGEMKWTIIPVEGTKPAADFYSYDNPAATSANTGFEASDTTNFFLYKNTATGKVSLFVIHDKPNDTTGGGFQLGITGAPSGTNIIVQDDPSDTYNWNATAGTGNVTWGWDVCCTDGFVLGGSLPGAWDMVLTPSSVTGIDTLRFISGNGKTAEYFFLPLDQSFTISCRAVEPPPEETIPNCPRGAGFWKQQCAQKGNGSTKYSKDDVMDIAAKVDEKSDFFDWSEGSAFDGFCRMIDPAKPMNQEKQLKRHFATMLANISVGELGYIAKNGSIVSLDQNASIDCDDDGADTVDELIDAIDAALEAGDWSSYGDLKDCAEAVNEGYAIEVSENCHEDDEDDDEEVNPLDGRNLQLNPPYPNPFRKTTRLVYVVPDGSAAKQSVNLGIYNVAGRLVRNLVNQELAAGRYEIDWDGSDAAGNRVHRGVYFVRGSINGVAMAQSARVIFLR